MSLPNRRVVALAYDGLGTFELGVAVELFGLPRPELEARGVAWYDFEVVAMEPGPLRATGGITITAAHDLAALDDAGTVIAPGWRDPDEAPPAVVVDALRRAHERGARLLSICSGVFVLAATGLLDGRSATTHWRYAERLAARHPAITVRPDVLYIDEGSVLTSAGSAAGIDACLHLIRRDHGAEVAATVARRLVVAPQREGGQAQFIPEAVPAVADRGLAPVLDWALAHLDEPLSVEHLARRAAMAPRTFARRFGEQTGTTPARWLVLQRLARARRLLETTDEPVDEVARRCGFGATPTLRHHFRRELQLSPSAYRSRFRSRADALT